jgi:hypothetical protein
MNLKISAALRALALTMSLGLVMFASGAVAAGATTRTVGNATSLPCTGTYSTISSAIVASSPGDTIVVCPGTYNEDVNIGIANLTLQGAKAGVDARTRAITGESIISSSCSPVQILANNVVLDGFTIQGSADPDPCVHAGIYTNPGGFGYDGGYQILNNIVQNNIIGIEMDNTGVLSAKVEHNLIQNNNNPGPDSGTGIDTNFGANKVTVNANKFVGNTNSGIDLVNAGGSNLTFSNNEFDSNRRAIGLGAVTSSAITGNNIHNSNDSLTADIRIFGGVSTLSITCNNLANGLGRAIRINDGGFGPNSTISINNNNISGYPIGLEENLGGYTGGFNSLDATNNWWGSSTGPTIASNSGGTGELIIDEDGVVKYSPFLTSVSSCAPVPHIGPPTNKDQCKNGGWQTFNTPRAFKNQGDCVSYTSNGK